MLLAKAELCIICPPSATKPGRGPNDIHVFEKLACPSYVLFGIDGSKNQKGARPLLNGSDARGPTLGLQLHGRARPG